MDGPPSRGPSERDRSAERHSRPGAVPVHAPLASLQLSLPPWAPDRFPLPLPFPVPRWSPSLPPSFPPSPLCPPSLALPHRPRCPGHCALSPRLARPATLALSPSPLPFPLSPPLLRRRRLFFPPPPSRPPTPSGWSCRLNPKPREPREFARGGQASSLRPTSGLAAHTRQRGLGATVQAHLPRGVARVEGTAQAGTGHEWTSCGLWHA